ncbi:hypothetical protein FS837_004123 [Tulasnella sp. UAMH 9824]|nr:hypothetical protein FS837_004123 [Tulasnella sp. UAMH 9824]
MTGELPYEGTSAEYVIICKIFQSPLPQVNGESRLRDCLQVWELMMRCWAVDPLQRPTSTLCQMTLNHLPRCRPATSIADSHTRSAILLENLGQLESWKGNNKAGFTYLKQALHLYDKEGDDQGIARVLRKQAAAATLGSNHVRAIKAGRAALDKCRSLQDNIGVADALFWIGSSFLDQDKRVDALDNLQESLKIRRAEGDDVGIAKCLERLGELYSREGQTSKASSTLKEAVDIASRCGDRLLEAQALISLGPTCKGPSRMDQAISIFQRAHDIAKNIGWEPGLSTCLCRLGSVKLHQGLHTEAEELLRESVRIARDNDAGWRLGQALLKLGKCFRAQGRLDEAIPVLEESCSAYQNLALDCEPALASAATLLAKSKSDLGYKEDALVWYDRAIAEWRKGGRGVQTQLSRCSAAKDAILADMEPRQGASTTYTSADNAEPQFNSRTTQRE